MKGRPSGTIATLAGGSQAHRPAAAGPFNPGPPDKRATSAVVPRAKLGAPPDRGRAPPPSRLYEARHAHPRRLVPRPGVPGTTSRPSRSHPDSKTLAAVGASKIRAWDSSVPPPRSSGDQPAVRFPPQQRSPRRRRRSLLYRRWWSPATSEEEPPTGNGLLWTWTTRRASKAGLMPHGRVILGRIASPPKANSSPPPPSTAQDVLGLGKSPGFPNRAPARDPFVEPARKRRPTSIQRGSPWHSPIHLDGRLAGSRPARTRRSRCASRDRRTGQDPHRPHRHRCRPGVRTRTVKNPWPRPATMRTVRLWDIAAAAKSKARLQGHTNWVLGSGLSHPTARPSPRPATDKALVKLWDVAKRTCKKEIARASPNTRPQRRMVVSVPGWQDRGIRGERSRRAALGRGFPERAWPHAPRGASQEHPRPSLSLPTQRDPRSRPPRTTRDQALGPRPCRHRAGPPRQAMQKTW